MSVKIYTTNTCPWCVKTKEYLASNGISYDEINVSKDREAAKEMIEKSGQRGVPVVDIDGSIVVGFDKNKLNELLNID
ncbi:glutaredoxin family protein [Clostridium sp. 19966]|uniref:glutaredoxin family protein n=1 Tax=Clostridium sp. 19966 TaxID=2768166 RepID=UPI0028DE8FD8|nr:glutaredoxin family protein [Clostridium sp. 19966]MDT8718943.1 glutaredoxin family protein [Clostridium sp. 19966]